jgi:murein L,D-transpeptidase YcbB/YkuD
LAIKLVDQQSMNETSEPFGGRPDRRRLLRRLAGAAAFTAAGAAARRAIAAPPAGDPLYSLLGDHQHDAFGQTFDQASRTIRMPKLTAPTLSPQTAEITRQAVVTYDGIVARGGWPQVPRVDELHLGMRHPSVVDLRQRLAVSGDLDPHAVGNDIYDSYVEAAVRRFQERHGLTPDGVLRAATLDAMNVPAATRRDQLNVNISRLKTLTTNLGPRYVVVNIPAARVEAIEHDVAVSRHTAVVGRPSRPSPDINSKIIEINFNPFWTVPVSIVRKDLIPIMEKQPDYLGKNHIRIYDVHHNELQPSQINWYSEDAVHYTFRQDPGDFNSLGRIRIDFPSPYGVYMHDTPEKDLFGGDFRYDSSGCCRVQNVRQLVYWLLDETKGWPPEAIDQAIESGNQINAPLVRPVPLHWVYVTAWSASNGVVQFRDDIYNRDGLGQPGLPPGTKT